MGYKYFLFILIGCMLFYFFSNIILYTPYKPLYRHSGSDHKIEEKESLLTPEHIKYVLAILYENNEIFYVDKGDIYIKRSLKNNEDLLSNYTMKALYIEKQ